MTIEQGEWYDRVRLCYAESHRFYHDERHLRTVLTLLQQRASSKGFAALPSPLFFAALYHDAIYEPWHSDNEERSAALCRAELHAAHLPQAIIERTVSLILSTRSHNPIDCRFDAVQLLDTDLWILGSSPTDYQHYADCIRQEYSHVATDAFRTGRAAILERFLERPHLYFGTNDRTQQREQQARRNLLAEIQFLRR